MKKKVMLVLPNLNEGGAQRVMLTLYKHLDRSLFDVSLVVVIRTGAFLKELPSEVQPIFLDCQRVRQAFFPMLRMIRTLQPDVLLSTLQYLNFIIILLKPFLSKKLKLIVREGNTPTETIKHLKNPWLWRILYRTLYPFADCVICQSDYMLSDLKENFAIPPDRLLRIYNPLDIDLIIKNSEGASPFLSHGHGPHLLTVGRLSYQKNMELLLASFSELLTLKPDAHLWILGTGSLESQLRNQIKTLKLEENVHLAGYHKDPYRWMKHADLLVLTSRYEGLPNVVLEALACDCPVVSVRHPGGTYEILTLMKLTNRWVTELNWSTDWFEKVDCRKALHHHFGIENIIRSYQKVFAE
ncbi:glycosyltransferase [Deltaproteobacteria bacterium TL4]